MTAVYHSPAALGSGGSKQDETSFSLTTWKQFLTSKLLLCLSVRSSACLLPSALPARHPDTKPCRLASVQAQLPSALLGWCASETCPWGGIAVDR